MTHESADGQLGAEDWLTQKELCSLLRMSEHTGSKRAQAGSLRAFEHGVVAAGRRRYSRHLVQLVLASSLEAARKVNAAQDPGGNKESQP